MTLNFSNVLNGYQIRGNNNIPYLFTNPESTVMENEQGEKIEGPFGMLLLKNNNSFWKGVEVVSLETFDNFEDFKSKYPELEEGVHPFIHYGDTDLINLFFDDIAEYLNHE